jgi:hypothetical protein
MGCLIKATRIILEEGRNLGMVKRVTRKNFKKGRYVRDV